MDYRLGNRIIHPTEPRVVAVLDWELATLGHPLADLAYNCLAWRLPSEAEYVQGYCRRAGRVEAPDMEFFIAFSLFRWAAIAVGVYRRALDGTAADARGHEVGRVGVDGAVRGIITVPAQKPIVLRLSDAAFPRSHQSPL